MNARKMLCSLFASVTLGAAAGTAVAQEAPQTPTVTATATQDAMPEGLLDFNVRDYFLTNESGVFVDSRGPMFMCGDNTQSCWTQPQREAWAVREFQAMMRVAVHTCQQDFPGENLIDSYNSFVVNNREALVNSFNTVDAFYDSKTESQRASMLAFDALDIATGNIFSGAGISAEYCQKAVPVLRYVANVQNDSEMVRVAHTLMLPRPAA